MLGAPFLGHPVGDTYWSTQRQKLALPWSQLDQERTFFLLQSASVHLWDLLKPLFFWKNPVLLYGLGRVSCCPHNSLDTSYKRSWCPSSHLIVQSLLMPSSNENENISLNLLFLCPHLLLISLILLLCFVFCLQEVPAQKHQIPPGIEVKMTGFPLSVSVVLGFHLSRWLTDKERSVPLTELYYSLEFWREEGLK